MTAPDPRMGEIEARLAKITPGPWERPLNTRYKASVTAEMPKGDPTSRWKGNVDHEGNPERVSIVSCQIWSDGKFFRKQSGRDLEFIANSPADVAYLLAELREARDALARVEELTAKFESNQSSDIAKRQNMQFDLGYSAGRRSAGSILREAVTAATGGGEPSSPLDEKGPDVHTVTGFPPRPLLKRRTAG